MPSTVQTICTGVVRVVTAALDGAAGGSLPGAALGGTLNVAAGWARGSLAAGDILGGFIPIFWSLEVALIEQTDAVRAGLAVPQRIESATVAPDQPPHLAPGRERQSGRKSWLAT